MARFVQAHPTPHQADPRELRGGVVVVIDQLRASTTIVAALAAGARCVLPCLEVEQARAIRQRLGGEGLVLGGERRGTRIEGFDLGNSPSEYTPLTVFGKAVIFTTTNGTAALLHAVRSGAAAVVVGCLANAAAVVNRLASDPRPVHLLCAGVSGELAMEDAIAAGAMGEMLVFRGRSWTDSDQGRLMSAAWREASTSAERLHQALRESCGGRNLLALGMAADVEFCSRVGVWDLTPELDLATMEIRPGVRNRVPGTPGGTGNNLSGVGGEMTTEGAASTTSPRPQPMARGEQE